MNIFGNTSEMYGDSPTIPICPSITWWQAHERAFETLHLHFENFLDALSTSYAKQKEAEALGLFIQGSLVKPLQHIFDAPWCFQIYKTADLPLSAQVRSQEFDFEDFIDHVFTKFIDAFIKEMTGAFLQLNFWSIFDIFDPRKLPQGVTETSSYGNR